MDMRQIKKILFDVDGTLFNTQQIHAEIESALLATKGVIISADEITKRYAGIPSIQNFIELLHSREEATALMALKRPILLSRMGEVAALYPTNFFEELRGRGYRFSLGTGASHAIIDPLLKRFGIDHYFEQVICNDDVREGKPHPETWERAAAGDAPAACLVVEDGIAGTEAAVSAGIRVALLLPREHLSAVRITSLDELLTLLP